MRGSSLVLGGLVVSCIATAALAQSSIDRSFKSTSKDCSGVQWTDAALKAYPSIASACQSVEERDGKTYVKFQGNVSRNIDRGKQLRVNFKDGTEMTLTPPENLQLYVNGRKTAVSDLARGDQLNFYVPEDRLAAEFADEPAPTPQTRYVLVPIVYREVVAMEDREAVASLPGTASDLPLIALSGLMLLGLGAGLTLRRMR